MAHKWEEEGHRGSLGVISSTDKVMEEKWWWERETKDTKEEDATME